MRLKYGTYYNPYAKPRMGKTKGGIGLPTHEEAQKTIISA
jgi:hypothetical protein